MKVKKPEGEGQLREVLRHGPQNNHSGKPVREKSQKKGWKRCLAEATFATSTISFAYSSASVLQSHAYRVTFSLPLQKTAQEGRKLVSMAQNKENVIMHFNA